MNATVKLPLAEYENLKKKADSVKVGYVYRQEYIGGYPVPNVMTESELVDELVQTIQSIAIANAKLHDKINKLSGELNKENPDKWTLNSLYKFLGLDK